MTTTTTTPAMITATSHDLTAMTTSSPISTGRLSIGLYSNMSTTVSSSITQKKNNTNGLLLQSTLTVKLEGRLLSLRFEGLYLLGLFETSTTTSTTTTADADTTKRGRRVIVVWNIVRGVMVHMIQPEDVDILDMTTPYQDTTSHKNDTKESVLVMVQHVEKEKLYVYDYALMDSGVSLTRKIKAGKLDDHDITKEGMNFVFAASLKHVAIGSSHHLKVMDRITGAKACKVKFNQDDTNAAATTTKLLQCCLDETHVTVRTGSNVMVYELMTGTLLLTIPQNINNANDLLCHIAMQDSLLLVDTDIYSIPTTAITDTNMASPSSVASSGKKKKSKKHANTATSSVMTTPSPVCTLQSPTDDDTSQLTTNVLSMTFDTQKKKQVQVLLVAHEDGKNGSSVLLQCHFIPLYHKNENDDDIMKKVLELPSLSIKNDDEDEDMTASKKRGTATTTTTSLTRVLGPGQAGTESMVVDDGPLMKKAKKARMEEVEDDKEEEPTIAERLAKLQDALEEEDSFLLTNTTTPATAVTTESLSLLLHQALNSKDDSMLELALSTSRDVSLMETTILQMSMDEVSLLLVQLLSRLSKRPNRAMALIPWMTVILQSGKLQWNHHEFLHNNKKNQANNGKDGNAANDVEKHVATMMATKDTLQVLRNLVQERIVVFPQLLQLEGRLEILASL